MLRLSKVLWNRLRPRSRELTLKLSRIWRSFPWGDWCRTCRTRALATCPSWDQYYKTDFAVTQLTATF